MRQMVQGRMADSVMSIRVSIAAGTDVETASEDGKSEDGKSSLYTAASLERTSGDDAANRRTVRCRGAATGLAARAHDPGPS